MRLCIIIFCLFILNAVSRADERILRESDLVRACQKGESQFEIATLDSSMTQYNIKFDPQSSIVSETQIQDIFKILANQPHIPYQRKRQGCEVRAMEMALIMDRMCLKSIKAFVRGTIYLTSEKIKWELHVAPALLVRLNNGKITPYIIDPSLYTKAVSLTEWASKLGVTFSSPRLLYITEQYIYLSTGVFEKQTDYKPSDLEMHKKLIDKIDSISYGIADWLDTKWESLHRLSW